MYIRFNYSFNSGTTIFIFIFYSLKYFILVLKLQYFNPSFYYGCLELPNAITFISFKIPTKINLSKFFLTVFIVYFSFVAILRNLDIMVLDDFR